jgi:hypothetical protein
VESRFKKYLGKTAIDVDGETYELTMKLADLESIMTAVSLAKDSTPGAKDQMFPRLSKTFKEIFKRSYPDAVDDELDAFLLKNYMVVLEKITNSFGLMKEEDLNKFRGPK